MAVHPFDENDVHELYLMTDDVEALVESMRARGIETTPVSPQGWGLLVRVTLPGGGKLGIYEPRHLSPPLGVPHARSKPSLRLGRNAKAARKHARPRRNGSRPRR